MAAWLRVEPVGWGGVCRRGVGTPFLCDSQVSGGRVLLCPSKVWWVLGLSCGPASSRLLPALGLWQSAQTDIFPG